MHISIHGGINNALQLNIHLSGHEMEHLFWTIKIESCIIVMRVSKAKMYFLI